MAVSFIGLSWRSRICAQALRESCVPMGAAEGGFRIALGTRRRSWKGTVVMARWNVRARSAKSGALAGALLAAVVLCVAAPAAAEVSVIDTGGGELAIEARDATVQEILEALGQTRTIQFQNSDALSRRVTGTYTGTLRRVLSRILEGYDHVIRSTASGIQIDVVGAAKSAKATASGGPTMTVASPRVGPRVAPRASTNVDADEDSTQTKPAPPPGPQTVNLAVGPRPAAPPAIQPSRAGLMGNAMRPGVSSNLDDDTAQ
jgi:hypothetical protein